jgi:hypothetical protein
LLDEIVFPSESGLKFSFLNGSVFVFFPFLQVRRSNSIQFGSVSGTGPKNDNITYIQITVQIRVYLADKLTHFEATSDFTVLITVFIDRKRNERVINSVKVVKNVAVRDQQSLIAVLLIQFLIVFMNNFKF